MPGDPFNLEALLQHAIDDRTVFAAHFRSALADYPARFDDLCNSLALLIARRFLEGALRFDAADAAMNNVWHLMVTTETHPPHLPEPAYAVYEAFDAGEYDHRDNLDPVEHHTKPALFEILGDRCGLMPPPEANE